MRLPIRLKIILPFAVLLIFVGVIGSWIATARLANAAAAEFDAKLLHSSLLANQSVAQLEAARGADLRATTDTVGVPEALLASDAEGLARLMMPIAANIQAASIQIHVLDARGSELLHVESARSRPTQVAIANPTLFAGEATVSKVLRGEKDALGERRVFLFGQHPQAMLYWVGPVRAAGGRVVGAVLVGQSIMDIASSIQGSAFYDMSGRLLATRLEPAPRLTGTVRSQVAATNNPRVIESQAGHAYGSLFSTWIVRGSQVGFLAVQASADPLQDSISQVRLILTLVFSAAALLTLLVGSITASLLTRPIDLLVRSMRAVSEGDLDHRATVSSQDEIGYLARTFNEMTASLQEKTAALEETYFASMEALARAIDARDPSTFGHSSRVAAISVEIGEAMHLDSKDREGLRRAALLHDIGKIGVEDKVLRKPGPLSDAETDHMREHPRIGYEMLRGLRFLQPSLPGVLYHHERWDGAGYPTGLSRTAIPLPVRILAVADVLDALTSDRPYRQGLGFEAAVAAIRNEAGLQFDPDVVSAFLQRRLEIQALLEKLGRLRGIVLAQPEAA
jgi:putative nucleotidyltransferase with HDIG domain